MADQNDSGGRRELGEAIAELINAGSGICDLVAIEWTAVDHEERVAAVERWQRAVIQTTALVMKLSNEATE